MVCIVSLMGVRRFLAVEGDCVLGGVFEGKVGQKWCFDFYTWFYTLGQHTAVCLIYAGFVIELKVGDCTFNPFVTGSTPVRPTTQTQ
jgi:hypothetical protein